MRELVIGSRGSALALWQTEHVRSLIRRRHPRISVRVEVIQTKGDAILDVALSRIGDRALFTKEIEQALIDRTIDLAVHSLKDMPTTLPDGLMLGAITERHAANDALVASPGTTLANLPDGATVATSSLRRRAQLLAHRPDLNVVDVRGNVQTRLARRIENGWEGMILALAGLERLELSHEIAEVIPMNVMLPAVGQGALAVEIRDDDVELLAIIASVDDHATRMCTTAERALLRALDGGCQVPVGAYAKIAGTTITLDALVSSLDGTAVIGDALAGPMKEPEELGERLAQQLIGAGADEILAAARAALL